MTVWEKISSFLNRSPEQLNIFKNISWAVAGKVVNILYGLFVGILVARYLGPEQFGLMNYVISYVTLFSVIATFGLDSIEVRELSKHPGARDEIMGSAFGLKLLLSIFTIALIILTTGLFEAEIYTRTMIWVYSLMVLTIPFGVIRNYFTSIVLNEYIVKTEIIRTLIGALIKIVLLVQKCSLTWFIIASTFDFFFIAGGYLYSYRLLKLKWIHWTLSSERVKELMREAFPLLLSGTAIIIYQRIDQVLVRNLIDEAALGQYSVAVRITNFIVFIPGVIATTVAPVLVKARKNNAHEYAVKRQFFLDILFWSGFVMSVVIFLFAKLAVIVLFGSDYSEAIPILQVLAWKAIFISMFTGSGQVMIIEGVQKWAVIRNVLGMIFSIVLNLLLIPLWGIMGSAISSVLTMCVSGFIGNFLIL